jgi:hypothetical protein
MHPYRELAESTGRTPTLVDKLLRKLTQCTKWRPVSGDYIVEIEGIRVAFRKEGKDVYSLRLGAASVKTDHHHLPALKQLHEHVLASREKARKKFLEGCMQQIIAADMSTEE